MTALAHVAGPVGAAGLGVLLLAPRRDLRMAGLAVSAAGAAGLAGYLAPGGHTALLAAAGVLGVAAAVGLAFALHRWPWLLPLLALACVPVRIRVTVGATDANLLVPLYGVIAAAALALGYQLLRGDGRARELGPIAWPLAALVGWSGLSLAWTTDLHEGAIELLFFFLPFGLLAICLARVPWRRDWLKGLYALLVGMALLFAGIGVYQYVTRDVFWNPKVIVANQYAPFYRVNSVFWDPSIYGRFLVVAILATLVLLLFGLENRLAIAAAAVIAVLWVGLFFSYSQSSFIALMAGVVLVSWLVWRRRAVIPIGLVAVGVLVVALALPSVRHRSLNAASGGRFELVSTGSDIALDHPVQGVGIGGFKREYAKRKHLKGRNPKAAASHDTPVTVAAETGLPGLALFAWLLVSVFLMAFRRVRVTFAGRVVLILSLSLAAIAVHSLFYNAFFEDPMAWGAFGLVPLAVAAAARERPSARGRDEPPPDGAQPSQLGREVETERKQAERVGGGEQHGGGQRDVEQLPEHRDPDRSRDGERDPTPLVRDGIDALGVHRHQHEHEGEG
jgi:O-antigen ligase